LTASPQIDCRRARPADPVHRDRTSVVPNELLFREVNEQIYLMRGSVEADAELSIICECERRGCVKNLHITVEDYEAVRRFPTRFVIKPGHAGSEHERVVEAKSGFVVVEKAGPAARVAIRLDPRRRRSARGSSHS